MKKLLFVLLLCVSEVLGANYYFRADGSAANKAAATGPESSASACINTTVHNAETFASGDTIWLSPLGDSVAATFIPPTSGVVYKSTSSGRCIFTGSSTRALCIDINAKNNITFDSIEACYSTDCNFAARYSSHGIILKNSRMHNGANENIYTLFGGDITILNCISDSAASDGVTNHDSSYYSAYNSRFLYNAGTGCGAVSSRKITLQDCYFKGNGTNLYASGAGYIVGTRCTTLLGNIGIQSSSSIPCSLYTFVAESSVVYGIQFSSGVGGYFEDLYLKNQTANGCRSEAVCTLRVNKFKSLNGATVFNIRGNFQIYNGLCVGGTNVFYQFATPSVYDDLQNVTFWKCGRAINQNSAYVMDVKNCFFDSCANNNTITNATIINSISTRSDLPDGNGNIEGADASAYYTGLSDTTSIPIVSTHGDTGGTKAFLPISYNGHRWWGSGTGWPVGAFDGASGDTLARFYGDSAATATSISMPCSTMVNATGDSGKVYFQVKLSGTWTTKDSTVWENAVKKDTLSCPDGLEASTVYPIRLYAITNRGWIDSTSIDSVTTLSGDITKFYVAKTGDDDNDGSSGSPWLTIGKAASTVEKGDTVVVKSGVYDECVTETTDGPIVYCTYGTDSVIVRGFYLNGSDSITVSGFIITHPDNSYTYEAIRINGTVGCKILNNVIEHVDEWGLYPIGSSYLTVRGNTFNSLGCSVDLSICTGSQWFRNYGDPCHNVLIEYNKVCRVEDYVTSSDSLWVVRNCVLGPTDSSDFDGDAHIDGWQMNGRSVNCFMISNYHYNNIVENSHFFLIQEGVDGHSNYFTVSKNVIINNGSRLLIEYTDADNLRLAHNSFSVTGTYPGSPAANNAICITTAATASENNVSCNNIFYQIATSRIYYLESGSSITLFRDHADDGLADSVSNIISDPTSVSWLDYGSNNFTLKLTAPDRDSGWALCTVTTANGTGTSFKVSDNHWFHDGIGLTQGDKIYVGGDNNLLITAINYSDSSITVSGSFTWAQGDSVGYAYRGDGPDIGAYEYGDSLMTWAQISNVDADYTVVVTGNVRFVIFYQDGLEHTIDYTSPYEATISSGTVTAKAFALHAQEIPVITASTDAIPTYTLTVTDDGHGSTTGGGTVDSGVASNITASPDAGYNFLNWTRSGAVATIADSTDSTTTVILTGDATVTANFSVKQFTLIMNAGIGTTTPENGPHVYDSAASVAISATPPVGYNFDKWVIVSGDLVLDGDSTHVEVDGDGTLRADYAEVLSYVHYWSPVGASTDGNDVSNWKPVSVFKDTDTFYIDTAGKNACILTADLACVKLVRSVNVDFSLNGNKLTAVNLVSFDGAGAITFNDTVALTGNGKFAILNFSSFDGTGGTVDLRGDKDTVYIDSSIAANPIKNFKMAYDETDTCWLYNGQSTTTYYHTWTVGDGRVGCMGTWWVGDPDTAYPYFSGSKSKFFSTNFRGIIISHSDPAITKFTMERMILTGSMNFKFFANVSGSDTIVFLDSNRLVLFWFQGDTSLTQNTTLITTGDYFNSSGFEYYGKSGYVCNTIINGTGYTNIAYVNKLLPGITSNFKIASGSTLNMTRTDSLGGTTLAPDTLRSGTPGVQDTLAFAGSYKDTLVYTYLIDQYLQAGDTIWCDATCIDGGNNSGNIVFLGSGTAIRRNRGWMGLGLWIRP